ncbi:MAG: hypothetical protein EF813_05265 [Methanosarcinales archaeon]|nr:MAG: hypothetical protein EF813_05265 [Methanosarcinales archaeon]
MPPAGPRAIKGYYTAVVAHVNGSERRETWAAASGYLERDRGVCDVKCTVVVEVMLLRRPFLYMCYSDVHRY